MGRPGITQQDIYNAAQKIAASGNFPTTQAIRELLGSGSCSTIHRHLLAWKKERITSTNQKIALGEYTKWLFNLEKENLDLKTQNRLLQDRIQELNLENAHLRQNTENRLFAQLSRISRLLFKHSRSNSNTRRFYA